MLGSNALKNSSMRPLDVARFWSKVDVDGNAFGRQGKCWNWRGSRQPKGGYGTFSLNGRTVLAHRVAYALFNGETPADRTIRHACDNPLCCQPGHLIAGTNAENVRDRVERNRGGSPLTPEAVLAIRHRASGGETQAAIAADYPISQGTVSNIVNRRTWRHVQ